jgi:cytidylate kinase
MTRSIEAIVEEQAHRWQLSRDARPEAAPRPVVTISRQHGAGGGDVARQLATDLGLDLFDGEIIQRVAESAHLSERVVASLDEKARDVLTDWLAAVASESYLSPAEYEYHLWRVVGTLAQHGGAVILGRGAHLILGAGGALRVLVVAPLDHRVRRVQQREGLSDRDARRRILEVESNRRAFLLRHFHSEFADPSGFDLVVNTAVLGVPGAARAVTATLQAARMPSQTLATLALTAPSR